MIQLTLIIPDQGKNDLPLPDGNYHVGAASDTNIQLPYPGVSKHHCMLSVKGDSLEVQDTNSSNGTFVKQSIPDNASGIMNNLIHGLNLSLPFPNFHLSGKEPIIGSFTASNKRAARNKLAIHPASIPNA